MAGFLERSETGGTSARGIFFLEDRSEHSEVCTVRRDLGYFCGEVTGNRDDWTSW